MPVHISDSAIFGNSWATPELRVLFDDAALVAGWIEVMALLAQTQAEFGLIPAESARQLAQACNTVILDEAFFAEAREDFERTNHSLLGLIRALQRRCPGDSGEWLCYGATVQDITDTQTARILVKVRSVFQTQLKGVAEVLCNLARLYQNAPMCGRTHGQPGLPITFGFKAAGWLDEMQRHRQRLDDLGTRLGVGQLAGGVGSLSSLGARGLALQQRFLDRLDLSTPAISWTASRDRLAEWLNLLALITATADRIGHEVYNLQRPEIGELGEGLTPGTVGSITMPQKRNPEISEHLGTLARQVRHQASQMMENLVHDHERDGRSWKGEWVILPAACLATGKALALLHDLLAHLEVNVGRMRGNLLATKGFVQAEALMLALAPKLGKQSAHALVHAIAMDAAEHCTPLCEAVLAEPKILAVLGREEIERLFDTGQATGYCAEMVDRVLGQVHAL
ncbi:MAG: adenylosuccinate lyase family protein [Candidatus Methylumidiphilus alinenensis]|uniref:Adenylosuccinate lyase family protein n=1 Tax=Candidatus Methylumidiphilus alinenensis TaxID=2202197 RepID=A0A2W4QFX7_9GAMM|nr:MAG: adenylosuccinate lyase family protein [Candidatus Methylumidiphilus alinenensis]